MVLFKLKFINTSIFFFTFTFQYGSIQIQKEYFHNHKKQSHLHSNMVLFKLLPQKVYLQHMENLHSNMVLFKLTIIITLGCNRRIYIPIWFYSNTAQKIGKALDFKIYIPIWFYSNRHPTNKVKGCIYLHSNMVLFKWDRNKIT